MIADLRALWQQAFGDSEETLDAFFATGFSPDRCHYLTENGVIVSTLYWFDCQLNGQKLAYLYAVATDERYRGRGLARRLMTQTHAILKEKGYAGSILVPGSKELFDMYEKLGYRTVSSVKEFSSQQGSAPVALRQINAGQYAVLRRQYLPKGGVRQEGATLDFLQTCCQFYAGGDFLLAAAKEGDCLLARELLGNEKAAPGILRELGISKGQFRTPGNGRDFAMYLPLTDDCPVPAYFGLALD
ncbi:MAG: GNAT family N-acetyltransferase [Oscillospiraceae bacterium]|nr:GNAT family N-acetyltransferase [Oscillospiraceae bacterium]